MKPCTRCGKRKTKTGVCGNCRFLVKMAASRKSPYKEDGIHPTRILGWERKNRKDPRIVRT